MRDHTVAVAVGLHSHPFEFSVACEVFGFPINPDVYYISQLPIHIEWSSVILIAASSLAISAVATLYPALIAARLRPAVGLRHD